MSPLTKYPSAKYDTNQRRRQAVMSGEAKMMRSGLMKKDMKINNKGRIVSKKVSENSKKLSAKMKKEGLWAPPFKRGCTYSRDQKKKCRSKKQHEAHMKKYGKNVQQSYVNYKRQKDAGTYNSRSLITTRV